MTVKEIMKYIESEYWVINSTPCEVCGGDYIVFENIISIEDQIPFNISECFCEHCGHEKSFVFSAPFIDIENLNKIKNKLN